MPPRGGAASVASNHSRIVFNEWKGNLMGPLPLGKVLATPGALQLLQDAGEDPALYLARHASGDWGDVPSEDARENERSLEHGWRVLSSYPVGGRRVWVITEADRSVTTILLPEEY